jgi:hypothetical protein
LNNVEVKIYFGMVIIYEQDSIISVKFGAILAFAAAMLRASITIVDWGRPDYAVLEHQADRGTAYRMASGYAVAPPAFNPSSATCRAVQGARSESSWGVAGRNIMMHEDIFPI